jgi:uncharacterized repeat protein (TIGR02543 family)
LVAKAKHTRLASSKQFSPKQLAFLVGALVLMGLYIVFQTFASDAGKFQAEATNLVAQYTLPEDGPAFTAYQPPVAMLYGNGLLLCGKADLTKAVPITKAQLSAAQIQDIVRSIDATGFKSLEPTYAASPGDKSFELATTLLLNSAKGTQRVMYFSGAKPPAFSKTEEILKQACVSATEAFVPTKIKVKAVKLPAVPGSQATNLSKEAAPSALSSFQGNVDLRDVEGQEAQALLEQLKGSQRGRVGDYEVYVLPVLPEYKLIEPPLSKPKEGVAEAAADRKVRIVWFYAKDQTLNTAQFNEFKTTVVKGIHDFYTQEVGKPFDIVSVTAVQGKQNLAYYKTCHNDSYCGGKAPERAVWDNLNANRAGDGLNPVPNLVNNIVTQFGGANGCYGLGWAGFSLSFDYNACRSSGTEYYYTIPAHEWGHGFGLGHSDGDYTLMDSYAICTYISNCKLNRAQADTLNKSLYFNESAAPAAPTGTKVDAPTASSLRVSWTAAKPAPGHTIKRYEIFSRPSNKLVGNVSSGSLSFVVSNLAACTNNTFAVRAIDDRDTAKGTSALSNDAAGKTTNCNAPAPTITSLSPATGSTNGGTDITITGTNFVSGATVKIGGKATSGTTFTNATTLKAKAPAGTAGQVDVVVANPDGKTVTKAKAYTYTSPPVVASLETKVAGVMSTSASADGDLGTCDKSFNLPVVCKSEPNQDLGDADGIKLNVAQKAGFKFNGWTGACTGTTCSVKVAKGQSATVTANYVQAPNQAPSKPAGVSALAVSCTTMRVSWKASTDDKGVTGYNVYRDNQLVYTTKALQLDDNKITKDGVYKYTIEAFDADGARSPRSDAASADVDCDRDPQPVPPATPTNPKAQVTNCNDITFSWQAIAGADSSISYQVYRNGVLVANQGSTSYVDTKLPAKQYTYVVRAFDKDTNLYSKNSAPSTVTIEDCPPPPDKQPPTIVEDVQATLLSKDDVRLAWRASADNVGITSYRVYRRTYTGSTVSNYQLIANLAGNVLRYDDLSAPSGRTLGYVVLAFDAAGNRSPNSTEEKFNNPCPSGDCEAPTAPSKVRATRTTDTEIVVEWDASTDNKGPITYRVFRNGNKDGETAERKFTLVGLKPNTTYQVRLQAYDRAKNNSPLTAVVSFKTAPPPDRTPPSAPTNLKASLASNGNVTLAWSASQDNVKVAAYYVRRDNKTIARTTGLGYSDPSLRAGGTYTYTVVAVDAANNVSKSSNAAVVTTPTRPDNTPPSTPEQVHQTGSTLYQINMAWTASADDSGYVEYEVHRDNQRIAAGVKSANYSDGTIRGGACYSYAIYAVDAAGNRSQGYPSYMCAEFMQFRGSTKASVERNSEVYMPRIGVQEGDLMLVSIDVVTDRPNEMELRAPQGWTLMRKDVTLSHPNYRNGEPGVAKFTYYRIATRRERFAMRWYVAGQARDVSGLMLVYAGVNSAKPIEQSDGKGGMSQHNIAFTPGLHSKTDYGIVVSLFGSNKMHIASSEGRIRERSHYARPHAGDEYGYASLAMDNDVYYMGYTGPGYMYVYDQTNVVSQQLILTP